MNKFRIFKNFVLCCGGIFVHTALLLAQSSPVSVATQPQGQRDLLETIPEQKHIHRFGFGAGIIGGDASAGRPAFLLSTMLSQPFSTENGLELSLHHQSVDLAFPQSPFGGFNYTASVWNADISYYAYPILPIPYFRLAGGFSLRHYIGANSTILMQTLPSGVIQSIRAIDFQNALAIGASLKADYIIATFSRSEIALRGQGYIYGTPFSGDYNQTPRGAAGGGISIQLLVQAYF